MSYIRWNPSEWYIFAHTGGGLAVWHQENEKFPVYTNEIIKHCVNNNDFSEIDGFKEKDRGLLMGIFIAYLEEYKL